MTSKVKVCVCVCVCVCKKERERDLKKPSERVRKQQERESENLAIWLIVGADINCSWPHVPQTFFEKSDKFLFKFPGPSSQQ